MNIIKQLATRHEKGTTYKRVQYFDFNEAYEFGIEIANSIEWLFERKLLTGRSCGKAHDYGLIAQMIYNAGHGNHLEIGTLWGASAIVAGLTKRKFNIRGKVYCVDPLDGYYGKNQQDKNAGGIIPTVERLKENLVVVNVEVVIVAKRSFPFPDELNNKKFVSAFIDGDHWGRGPINDWNNASARTTKYIALDNYDKKHPAVVETARKADWTLVHLSSIVAILENPKR